VLLGAASSYGFATAIAILWNPKSADYFHRSVGRTLEISTGIGGVLRIVFGMDHVWLQFLPCVFGLAWFLWYWTAHRNEWDWQTCLPLLLLVSVSTSPYFWNADFILTFPAIIALAAAGGYRDTSTLMAYLACQELIVFTLPLDEPWSGLVSSLWIGFYCVARYFNQTLKLAQARTELAEP
jgi:hypothetical protein